MHGVHYDILMFIGEQPEGGRVVYLDTFAGPTAMQQCRTRFYMRVGNLDNLLGSEAKVTNRSGLCYAEWDRKLGLHGEAPVHLRMEYREAEEEDNSDLVERGYARV